MPFKYSSHGFKKRLYASKKYRARLRSYRRGKRLVQRTITQGEPYKYHNINLSNSMDTSWSIIANLTNVPFNSDDTTQKRQSTKIKVKNLAMNFRITPALGDDVNIVRLAIVRGRRSGALSADDIAYDPNATGDDLYLQFDQKLCRCEVVYNL